MIKSFCLSRKSDEETYNLFESIRHKMKMKRSEAVIKALTEFNVAHPCDKINPLDNYSDDKPKNNLPLFSPNSDLKEIKRICSKMNNDELIQMKNLMKKINNIIDFEMERRVDR